MPIVAHSYPCVIGVDTHAKNHVYAVVSTATGQLLETRDFPTTSAGISRAIAWAARRTDGDLAALWVIEGAGSYGAILAGAVGAAGYEVVEAPRMDARAGVGDWASQINWTLTELQRRCCPWKNICCADHD